MIRKLVYPLVAITILLSACSARTSPKMILPTVTSEADQTEFLDTTPYPTRPAYDPGELVDYMAQAGDTLPGLAARFNTSVDEIQLANTVIPDDATTMPPGLPMQIPIYYRPLWGTPFQILPDAAFVNGPNAAGFDTHSFILESQGWLSSYSAWAFRGTRSAAELVDNVADNYSISPKLLLVLLEYQGNAFSAPFKFESETAYILGLTSSELRGVYLQLTGASDILNDGYYRWREGNLIDFVLEDGTLVRPDPWQNAATVALQYYFSKVLSGPEFHHAIGPDGLIKSYQDLFGDPWAIEPHIPGSLQQPDMLLPFTTDKAWAFTGGPHTGWGNLAPWAALDFAPPTEIRGCFTSSVPTTAVADGLVVRDGSGFLMLDLDGDGDERTGWVVLYLHIADEGRVPVGTFVNMGDPLGFPSCEGGRSTGTHIHIARKYNGEWMAADGVIPFTMSGWRPMRGDAPYQGWLVKDDWVVVANINPNHLSFIPSVDDE